MGLDQRSSLTREFAFLVVLFAAIGWLIIKFQVLFGPLIISGLIAYLLYPLVTWLSQRTRIDRRKIVVVVYLVFLLLLIWGIVYLVPAVVNQASMLDLQILRFRQEAETLQNTIERTLGFDLPLEAYFEEFDNDLGQLLQPERAFRIILNATTNVVWVIVIVISSFHLLRDWEKLREWGFGLLPEDLEAEYRRLHKEIKQVWQSYLRGQLLIMFFIGLFSGVGAAAVGIRSALLLGLIAGALALIPNIGPATATVIAAIVAYVQGSNYLELSNLSVTLIVVAIFGFVQAIEGLWLTPRIMSRQVNIHPGVIMVLTIGTLFTFGALIALIIVPLLGSLVVVVQYIRSKRAGLDPWAPSLHENNQLEELDEMLE